MIRQLRWTDIPYRLTLELAVSNARHICGERTILFVRSASGGCFLIS